MTKGPEEVLGNMHATTKKGGPVGNDNHELGRDGGGKKGRENGTSEGQGDWASRQLSARRINPR